MRKNLKILNHAYAYSKIKMVYYVLRSKGRLGNSLLQPNSEGSTLLNQEALFNKAYCIKFS